MYVTGSGVIPYVETDAVEANNGPRTVEMACMKSGLPYTFMRPQYVYGPTMHRRYLDYFLGRAARGLPIPLPMNGEQLVGLTHSTDVASLIAAAVGHPAAVNEAFNCGTDTYVGYKAFADMVNSAWGNAPEDNKYLFFDPKDFDIWEKSDTAFPFRRETFVTSVDKAKNLLSWSPKHDILSDVAWLVENYRAQTTGGMGTKWGPEELKCDLEIMASKDFNFMFTYPFFDDEEINTESMPYAFEAGSQFIEDGRQ